MKDEDYEKNTDASSYHIEACVVGAFDFYFDGIVYGWNGVYVQRKP